MHHRARDLTGYRSNRLVGVRYVGSEAGKSRWEVRCDCGTTFTMAATELTKGRQKSCGCARGRKPTHGMSKHPIYAVWRSMMDRCRLPTHQAWKNYGGRGIKVSPRWMRFEDFWADMGPTYRPGLTLERIDNDAGYGPENCRWATAKDQARNKRRNRKVDSPWGLITVAELSERTGIGQTTLLYRMSRGVEGADLLSPPDVRNRFTTS